MQRVRTQAGKALALEPTFRKQGGRARQGWSMFLDRRVPFHVKVLALTLGGVFTFALLALEIPLEGVLALLIPILGLPFDFTFDGAEMVAFPLLFASLLLPSLAGPRFS